MFLETEDLKLAVAKTMVVGAESENEIVEVEGAYCCVERVTKRRYDGYNTVKASFFFVYTSGLSFAIFTATLTHKALFHGREIWQQTKATLKDKYVDVHTRIMKKNYDVVPQWWFSHNLVYRPHVTEAEVLPPVVAVPPPINPPVPAALPPLKPPPPLATADVSIKPMITTRRRSVLLPLPAEITFIFS
ncbi:hypothetical protein SADUNF_Sadunf16G0008900 [Salix dunnii]|uniref:Uncharacterized protein n=1 Tax=Salix dunnii TaxID=1413687 RepID=A0A835J7R4_9ROSI|nr:hypothetical protein SADUNF_Sadunf16G0008900 [Salix dunnii]